MLIKSRLILLLLLGFITRVGYSQLWYFNEVYNPNNTWASGASIIGTSNGYFGCAISSDSVSDYYYTTCTFVINHNGHIVSWKNFGQNGFDFYPGWDGSLTRSQDSCYALFGSQHNYLSGFSNGIFYKFNLAGDTIFTRSIVSETYNMLIGRTCVSSIDKGYALLGEVGDGTNYGDLILIKTDDDGNEAWRRQYGTSIDDVGVSIVQTIDSGYLIGSWSRIPGPENEESSDPIVYKTDSLGNFEWSLNLGGPYKDGVAMVCNTQDSCIMVLTAYADSMFTFESAYTRTNLIKIDLEGNVLWNKKYGPSNSNYISNIQLLDNGDFMVCGYVYNHAYLNAGWLFRFNSDGDSLWYREYFYYPDEPVYGQNYIYDVSQAEDNGFVAVGQAFTIYPPNNVQKMWVLKVDSVGCEIENCWVGIEEEEETGGQGDKETRRELEVWPNPARTIVNCQLSTVDFQFNSKFSIDHFSLVIYDIFGSKVEEIIFSDKQKEVQIDVEDYPPGIYLAVVRESQAILASAKFVVAR